MAGPMPITLTIKIAVFVHRKVQIYNIDVHVNDFINELTLFARFARGYNYAVSFWATVRPMISDRCHVCLFCLSCPVCNVGSLHCGQKVGGIKMKLIGTQVGLGPGHTVLDGDSAPLPKGAQPPLIFGPYLLRPNRWMDQDATCYGGKHRPRRLCVRWGPRCPFPEKGAVSAHVYCGQTGRGIKMVLGMEVGLSPGDFVRWDPVPFPQKGAEPLPNFRPISIVAKRLDVSRCHLVWM